MKIFGHIRGGFTLVELLVVVAIMGMMGTMSVISYRSMRRGMEENAVMRNASQFVRLAYQRSKIDRVPVNVYFWNETVQVETDDTELKVVGHCVAVRRNGRITRVNGQRLVDEFGDLAIETYRNSRGEEVEGNNDYKNDAGRYLYRVNGYETEFARSVVSQTAVIDNSGGELQFISHPDEQPKALREYAYYVIDWGGISDWAVGDAYGFEFAELELPSGFIFGNNYSRNTDSPYESVKVMCFNPTAADDGGGEKVLIAALRPDKSGALAVKSVDMTTAPNTRQAQQN